MTGKDTHEMATMWFVLTAMCATQHETLYAPVHIEIDAENRIGKGRVDGIVETQVVPIPNIVSGDPHRISINCRTGSSAAKPRWPKGSARPQTARWISSKTPEPTRISPRPT